MSGAEPLELRDERARQAHDLLVERLRALTTSDQWLAMLETSRRFHTYSARNVLLLLAQGAQGHVAGYRTWQTIPAQDGGTCQVRKGARAMTVLAPITRERDEIDPTTGEPATRRALVAFKAVRVFDETALVVPPAIPHVMPELLQGDGPHHVWDALARQVHAAKFTLQDGDCAPANGRTDWTTRTVTIRADLDPAQRTKTLAHELAHIHLHDPDQDVARRSSRERMEVEAESVAYLVCAHAGIDSAQYTLPYVAHWSGGDVELVQDSAERVITAARVITGGLDRALEPTRTPDGDVCERDLPLASTDDHAGRHHHRVHAERVSPLGVHGREDESLASVRARVERDAARLLAQLAANPDAWGADPQTRDALQRAERAATPPASPAVAAARQRLGDLLHHRPVAPEPPELGPIPDLQ